MDQFLEDYDQFYKEMFIISSFKCTEEKNQKKDKNLTLIYNILTDIQKSLN